MLQTEKSYSSILNISKQCSVNKPVLVKMLENVNELSQLFIGLQKLFLHVTIFFYRVLIHKYEDNI